MNPHWDQYGLVRILAAAGLLYFFAAFATGAYLIPVTQGEPEYLILQLLAGVGSACAVLFFVGSLTRFAALGGLICLNGCLVILPVVAEIHYPLLSLLLGTFAIFSSQPWAQWRPRWPREELRDRDYWYLPLLYSVFLGLTFLGAHKLLLPLWLNGEAVRILCPASPLARSLPAACSWLPNRVTGWIVVVIELASFPMALNSRTRPVAWLMNVVLQLGILQFLFLRRITFVMLVTFFFLFDLRWVQQSNWPRLTARGSSK